MEAGIHRVSGRGRLAKSKFKTSRARQVMDLKGEEISSKCSKSMWSLDQQQWVTWGLVQM